MFMLVSDLMCYTHKLADDVVISLIAKFPFVVSMHNCALMWGLHFCVRGLYCFLYYQNMTCVKFD